jgi:hypothetical protein
VKRQFYLISKLVQSISFSKQPFFPHVLKLLFI